MLWHLILGSVFCTCALASYYAPNNDDKAAQAYEMQKLLDIESFFEVQSKLDLISAALNENTGLEYQADQVAQALHEIYPQIEYLLQITEDLANPCSDGIYRNGKCANYILATKFTNQQDAENLCLAHFGEFAIENIIDYSDGPYGNHGGGYQGGGYHGGGYYGDSMKGGGNYGDSTKGGGYYGGTTNGDGYFGGGDAPPPYGGDAPPPYGGDVPPPYGGDVPLPNGGDSSMPPTDTDDDDVKMPEAVEYYVCYEPPVVNIPKSIYFPWEFMEEEHEGEITPTPTPFPKPGEETWFSGKLDPKADEDECPYTARHGAVIGDMCYAVYDELKDWVHANRSCEARGGHLCEPSATIAESAVFYSWLKAKLGEEMAEIETAATPNPSHPGKALLWLGWARPADSLVQNPFSTQIFGSMASVPNNNIIFDPEIESTLTTALAAALTEPGNSWEGKDPATKLAYCCQYNLV